MRQQHSDFIGHGDIFYEPAAWGPPPPQYNYMQAPPDVPSFMGAASRKRKWEVAVEKGLVPPRSYAQPAFDDWGKSAGKNGGKSAGKSGGKAAGKKGDSLQIVPPRSAQKGANGSAIKPPSGKGAPQGKGGPRAEAAAQANVAKEALKWITLPNDANFVTMGMPELGPTVYHHADLATLLSSSSNILSDLGAGGEQVTLTHDAEWQIYPEVAQAIKAAGGEEQPFCIAECSTRAIWAVGAASGWKKREQAARLAMSVALAANAEDFVAIVKAQPEFTRFCEAVGIQTGVPLDLPPEPVAKKPKSEASMKPGAFNTFTGKGGKGQHFDSLTASAEPVGAQAPFWISVAGEEASLAEPLDSLLTEALVLANDGKHRKGLFANADGAVTELLGDMASEVTYHDDPNWENFPVVGAQVKEKMEREECMTIAACPAMGFWAAGVGMKGKNRHAAAKVALVLTVVLQSSDSGTELDLSNFPAMAEILDEVRAARG